MNKKLLFGIIIFFLAGAGIFYWAWQNQSDVRALNKTLPAGVRVSKSFFRNEYQVKNKIDGYEFKVPQTWKQIYGIAYDDVINNDEIGFRNRFEPKFQNTITSETFLEVTETIEIGEDRGIRIRKFLFNERVNLKEFAEAFNSALGLLQGRFTKFPSVINTSKIGEKTVEELSITVKSPDYPEEPFLDVIFFGTDSEIYAISTSIENSIQFIKDVILSGNW